MRPQEHLPDAVAGFSISASACQQHLTLSSHQSSPHPLHCCDRNWTWLTRSTTPTYPVAHSLGSFFLPAEPPPPPPPPPPTPKIATTSMQSKQTASSTNLFPTNQPASQPANLPLDTHARHLFAMLSHGLESWPHRTTWSTGRPRPRVRFARNFHLRQSDKGARADGDLSASPAGCSFPGVWGSGYSSTPTSFSLLVPGEHRHGASSSGQSGTRCVRDPFCDVASHGQSTATSGVLQVDHHSTIRVSWLPVCPALLHDARSQAVMGGSVETSLGQSSE
ncbi:hypothetical protein IWX49DRAFT_256166 [Phyllosticta citricarpa]|uniref:Uncharacterized protein n=1 Tax=Phyllosticta citricarpa TaxID=55181 RepID=A0ABR1LN42_9PEZI